MILIETAHNSRLRPCCKIGRNKKLAENFANQRIIINFAAFLAQSLAGHAARYIA
jgi:hypothetical protein